MGGSHRARGAGDGKRARGWAPAGAPLTVHPRAADVGDPYFPGDGNGGYDVATYDLGVRYDPATDVLQGTATIRARATQNLSAFNLDLLGLTVSKVNVDGRKAGVTHVGQELTITPQRGIRKGAWFTTVVHYSGVPGPTAEGDIGFFHTDDGALVVGQPHVASTWFPANDHPSDAAAYSFRVTVPSGLEAIANGDLTGSSTKHGWTTWSWVARDPMTSYLATLAIGEFDVTAYRQRGISYLDAIDPDLFVPPIIIDDGLQVASSQQGSGTLKRLTRQIEVPAEGASLSFRVAGVTEEWWDFFFVEAHTVGLEDWTTLADINGHTSDATGGACYGVLSHPALENYLTYDPETDECSPTGASGAWNAVTGDLGGWQDWTVDLNPYAGTTVEVSLTYASDAIVQAAGLAIDSIVVSTGVGNTSFEPTDDPTLWTSDDPVDSWIVVGADGLPPSYGQVARDTFARQPEIIEFLSGQFGRYPWRSSGGIVDDLPGLGFALETQTRPVYALDFFGDPVEGAAVVVHELAHQWFGDSLRLATWQDIWLNEGFATYAEWLWSEYEGRDTPQDLYDFYLGVITPDDPFWELPIGDPGPDGLFDGAVYLRGAMTLHTLRLEVGDRAFFRILQTWAARQSGQAVTTEQFIDLAERIAHRQLDDLFATRLGAGYPGDASLTATATARVAAAPVGPPVSVQLHRLRPLLS